MGTTSHVSRSEVIHHLPGLAMTGDEPVAALDGYLARLAFDEFAQLDPDWAHERYFEARSTVWRAHVPTRDGGDEQPDAALQSARLIQLAASAVCERPLPDPALSMLYRLRDLQFGFAYSRVIGKYERTWLLSNKVIASPEPSQWLEISTLAETWRAGGLTFDSQVFMPLQAFSSVRAAFGSQPALMMMPVVVALEGVFAPGKVQGIARRMTANIARVLPGVPDLEQRMRALYSIRSEIIHGRAFDAEQAAAACATAGWLACRATRELASAMARARSSDVRAIFGAWD